MIADLIKRIFPPKDVVGIDIGSYSVKIVCFTEEKKELKLKDWGYIPLSFKPDVPPEERRLAIAQEIRTHLKKKGVSARYAAVSISGNAVIVRYVKFPKLTRKELDLTLSVEAEPFIPFDIKDVDLTCYILNDTIEEGQPKMDAVLVAAKKEAVADKLEILSAAGLEPLVIDVDSFALETLYERLQPKPEGTVLFLNIGHKVTNLSIVSQGVTRVVRDIFIAGAAFDKAISKLLKAEPMAADILKKSKGLLVTDEEKQAAVSDYDKEGIAVSKAATGVLRDLYTEVSRSIDFYLSQGAENSVSRIMLSGGIANLGNIGKFLSAEFKVPVETVNPFSFLGEQPMARNIPRETLPALSVAAGLALRRMKDWE
ncbi:MAG TPA: type IV pilus assembly protein PilM [Elusimicrobiales bacterium]|nr:type IV pilus assembly protein PilM [Elusimicrobiales bacterium]